MAVPLLSLLDWFGMLLFIMGYSMVVGATGRLLFGYDSFGNVCGKKNSPVEGAPLSGQDMTLKRHVFFMNSCNPEVKDVRLSSTILCVSSCPEEQLDTLEEVQLFADKNGSFLCVYSLNSINYTQNPNADSLCPRLPVPPRCVPQTPECYSLFASVLINDVDTLHQILSGIMSGRDTVLGLCILALALSLAMMFTFWFITTLLVHIFIALTVSGLLFVLITAVLLSLIFVFRKRIKLTVELFQVINKAISNSPFLLFQPLWTFAILIFFWVLWVAVLLSLGTAGAAQVIEGGQVEYKPILENAYAATAINGTDFCTSAKDALKLLSKNSSHFTSVNCFGDFIIFLGKVLVMCLTVFGGLMAFNYNRALQVWAVPLLLVAFFAYFVAHSFLSVFETVLDALFLCFAVDLETNDGSSEKPYFMDQEFLFCKKDQQVKRHEGTGGGELTKERGGNRTPARCVIGAH
ncbi:choline transporter-like protein 3 [Prionailurus iriomotensis]